MTTETYLETLPARLAPYFTVEEEPFFQGAEYELVARHVQRETKTTPGGHAVDGYVVEELCLVSVCGSDTALSRAIEALPVLSRALVRPADRPRETTLVRVLVTNNAAYEAVQAVKRLRAEQVHKGPHWDYVSVQVVLVDVARAAVTTNLAGERWKKVLAVEP